MLAFLCLVFMTATPENSANQDKVFFIEPPVVIAAGRMAKNIRVWQHFANICANLSPSSTTWASLGSVIGGVRGSFKL